MYSYNRNLLFFQEIVLTRTGDLIGPQACQQLLEHPGSKKVLEHYSFQVSVAEICSLLKIKKFWARSLQLKLSHNVTSVREFSALNFLVKIVSKDRKGCYPKYAKF